MCGICGMISAQGSPPPDTALLLKMMGRISHRGPDGSGYYRDGTAALGHTRLAIIDTEGGAQPLSNEDGTLWIVFNGEIYNYVELAAELKSLGHSFRTASDTEVIVHSWEQWGEKCFTRFNGQWAIALWDSRAKRLVLSKDRMGVRPLYFTDTHFGFLFASEVKSIFAHPGVERALDPRGMSQILGFWCPVAPQTIFKGVRELPPGHYAVLERGRLTTHPYWTLSFPAAGREKCQSLEENGRLFREKLIEAVRLRFIRSDVPVGAYLSGGIDSSVSAAIIARYTQAPLRTFSLRFTDPEFDEGPYQKEMARRLGTDHRSVEVSASDIGEVFPDVIRHTEKPILRSAPAPLFLLSRLVRRSGYKVVVTGEGSDEVLSGYDIFREAKVRLFWARNPGSAMRERAVELLYPWMVRSPTKAPSLARAFFGRSLDPADPALSHRPRWESTQAVKGLLSAEWRRLTDAEGLMDQELIAQMPTERMEWDPISRAQWLEMTTLLSGYILSSQGDRMLMAHSVEGRFPFLDPEVVELANSLPARHKLMALDEKHILKREFADLIPTSILNRPKQPYRSPDASSFFSGRAPDWVEAVTSESEVKKAGIFEPSAVTGLVRKCTKVSGERMSNTDNMRVLAVVSTGLMHRFFISQDGGSGDERPAGHITVHDMMKRSEER